MKPKQEVELSAYAQEQMAPLPEKSTRRNRLLCRFGFHKVYIVQQFPLALFSMAEVCCRCGANWRGGFGSI